MPTEIERKFLLKDESWRNHAGKGTHLRQGYLCLDKGRVVRVRTKETAAFLTIKGERQGISASEFEYPLPLADAEELLRDICVQPVIEKIRYEIVHEGFTWEVDEFFGENEGLFIAEVELESEEQRPPHPPWVGAEVSDDRRYSNASLVTHPYREWKERKKHP
ncbi:CYTH domain-containing protein [Geomesophilobacter sediminis]|uniref:CYTH domain-containing protein n=1 Tax=Geomesophilobacter sediminis TaxID=2798584 RepID=A0A8J7S7L0_9BACT|nr:CYTH domain-containing protein [Geomesophilobacter sediminis]MBJ6726997.1 CYTH domain-containing protein [Geomesophilobacter sediminis]